MTAEQKQRAADLLAAWRATAYALHADRMADLLQELVDAPEAEPVARVTGYYAGYLSISTIAGRVLPAGTALYLAPPAPSVPDGWKLVPYTPTEEMLEQAAYAVNSRPKPSKYEATATPAIIFWNAMLKYSPESTGIKEPPAKLNAMLDEHRGEIAGLKTRLAEAEAINSIDARFCGRLALILECVVLDPHGHFDLACQLLEEYKAEWEKVNPSPPTFMGEPMPPERRARLLEMKAKRNEQEQSE